jgi:hypothetical protein
MALSAAKPMPWTGSCLRRRIWGGIYDTPNKNRFISKYSPSQLGTSPNRIAKENRTTKIKIS